MSEIVTLARSSGSSIRFHGFPTLEAGNLSFPAGRYTLDFKPGRDRSSFDLEHRIMDAPLISRLLKQGKACYVCAVSSPISSYRQTHVSDTSSQRIQWSTDDLGEPPLFTPMIVSVVACELQLDRERDGVHEVWHNQRVVLAKGNRLALGPVVQLRSSILQLLSLHVDEKLEDGAFFVAAETEQEFRFRVNLNPHLHGFLKHADKDGIRGNIMTHIVTACLSLLQRDFAKDDDEDGGWKSHRNLRMFAKALESKHLPHWNDESFRPEEVATSLHPHSLPRQQDGEDA